MMFQIEPVQVAFRRAWPPPPHDPRERVVVAAAMRWQVRVFPAADPKVDYFAQRGLWHLQLWHPRGGVSILSPSLLTADAYEVFPVDEWKRRARDHKELAAIVRRHHALEVPSRGTFAVLEAWFVDEVVRRSLAGFGAGAIFEGGFVGR